MKISKIDSLAKWIKKTGFELVYSYEFKESGLRINYYFLGNFGFYEKVHLNDKSFTIWNPWGIEIEVHSLDELYDAYYEYLDYSPELTS